jgi:hypothetical protein
MAAVEVNGNGDNIFREQNLNVKTNAEIFDSDSTDSDLTEIQFESQSSIKVINNQQPDFLEEKSSQVILIKITYRV